jgi:predicted dithiol-disulfide oxidoreductase (DUF899 family)
VSSMHRRRSVDRRGSCVDRRGDGRRRKTVPGKTCERNFVSAIKTKGEVIMATATSKLGSPKVVSQTEWLAARKELLAKEKEFTRLRDELSRQRRELPWEKVEKNYVFDGPNGKEILADLFGSKSQLIIYHFMLGPDWVEGCAGCSFVSDHIDGIVPHLAARDIRMAVVSRAPLAQIETFKKRMGWRFLWVSSFGSDFNYDYHVSATKEELAQDEVYYNYKMQKFPSEERPGTSVFYKDESGNIFHTYSSYARGGDLQIGAYNWIDLTPKGRDEDGLKHKMNWLRHHDKYDDTYKHDAQAAYVEPAKSTGSNTNAKSSCCRD